MTKRVATDVGGTFTDLASYDAEANQILISKASTTANVSDGVAAVIKKAGITIAEMDYFVHGSTVAINTAIERKGAVTGLLSTEGFRDVLEIAAGNIVNSFDLMFTTPEPLVPRKRRLEVSERMLSDGQVLRKLDVQQAIEAIHKLERAGVEAIGICLLHSYANPQHERDLKELVESKLKDSTFLSVSSEIVREAREFHRTSTTVMNAYVGPRVSGYLDGIQEFLSEGGFRGNAMIMQSSGGTMSIEVARRQPVRMMESGPVGGTVAAAHAAIQAGFQNVVAFDMGGTTAKVSIVIDGHIDIAEGYWIDGEERGYPIQIPVVDVVEIGAGGGSIAHIDELGALKIGPQSAGSVPGPVAYGNGGVKPTVTDANLVLGRLNPTYFLGGEIGLSVERAKDAIQHDIADPLQLEISRAAFGIVKIADTHMAHAVRQMTVQKGRDPREFVLFAYGGGGPGQAVAIARELGIGTVVIPPHPGIFSAIGMLLSDAKESLVLSRLARLVDLSEETLGELFKELESEGVAKMQQTGFALSDIEFTRSVDMRYTGQESSLRLSMPNDFVDIDVLVDLHARFSALSELRYGHAFESSGSEIVSLRVEVFGRLPKPDIKLAMTTDPNLTPESRMVYFEDEGYVECEVYRREQLTLYDRIEGPAIIEELASTTLIHPGDSLSVDDGSNLIISVGAYQMVAR